MNTKKVNQMMKALEKVAKGSAKVVAASLPVASIAANALDSARTFPTAPDKAIMHFVGKYNGVDPETGQISLNRAMEGTGALLLSGIAAWAIRQLG